jgi:hypothetical protein
MKHFYIMASNIDVMSQQINLKTLNLCGNPLNGFPSITSSRTLETLCLEGRAAVLPRQAAAKFPQLADVTLVAPSHSVQVELDSTTQSELSKFQELITLSIGKNILHVITKIIPLYHQLKFPPRWSEPLPFFSALLYLFLVFPFLFSMLSFHLLLGLSSGFLFLSFLMLSEESYAIHT